MSLRSFLLFVFCFLVFFFFFSSRRWHTRCLSDWSSDVCSSDLGWLDFSLMLFFLTAAFFGGVLQLYNLADRGFSLRILIDIEETDSHPIDADWLIANYGGGKGLIWMYGKRIEGLLATKLVDRKVEVIELTSKGERAADVFLAVRRFLRLELQS